ncbi:hypothetical protein Glove_1g47 [Diversispora epigaea]|uniref:Uncharacterized protein n=1 Tax=Diversispora epigaea TaxID=1348612 RepID=A0A397JS94_9GLOM|nr:hypothetical protein Glove_1g47 [Diversispora epigaea]
MAELREKLSEYIGFESEQIRMPITEYEQRFWGMISYLDEVMDQKIDDDDEAQIDIEYQRDISGEETSGRVDYAISGMEDLLCITEGKPRNIKIGYLWNIKQLESSFHTNKKRTVDQAFNDDGYNYLYGIVSTGADWHFIMFTSDGLYCTSKTEYQIDLTKKVLRPHEKST